MLYIWLRDKEGTDTCTLFPDAWAVTFWITDLPFGDRCQGIKYLNVKNR